MSGISTSAYAVPVTVDILTSSNYSLVLPGNGPSGVAGGSGDWLRFDPNQTLDLDRTNNILMLGAIGQQIFTVKSNNGDTGEFTITKLYFNLNDTNGNGSNTPAINIAQGAFIFPDINMGDHRFCSDGDQLRPEYAKGRASRKIVSVVTLKPRSYLRFSADGVTKREDLCYLNTTGRFSVHSQCRINTCRNRNHEMNCMGYEVQASKIATAAV